MFKSPFSFKGRIGMLEYLISILICNAYILLVNKLFFQILEDKGIDFPISLSFLLPAIYFILTQGVKRNHDIGNTGWFILIPWNSSIILFIPGEKEDNKYGKKLDS